MQKIEELVQCRNLIAHNSYIGPDEIELIYSYLYKYLKTNRFVHIEVKPATDYQGS
jgi:hypothetical protein